MSQTVELIDELVQVIDETPTMSIFELPEDLLRFICVHVEYKDIIQGIHISCKRLYEITKAILNSNYYIYRLHIIDLQLDDPLDQKPLKIVQIKYFNEYKYLLSSSEFNKRKNETKALYDPAERCKISLRGCFGQYVSAEPSGIVLCNRPQSKEWECFTSIPLSQNKIALRSHHNTFVSASSDHTLHSNLNAISQCETFTIHPQSNGTFAFKSSHNKYLSSQPDGTVEINRDKALKWEGFHVDIIDDLHYKDDDLTAFDQRIPTSYILLRYNKYYDNDIATQFRTWLRKSWNSGNIFCVACHSVHLFQQFMQRMHPQRNDDEKQDVIYTPETVLSLHNTVQLLRLTNRAAPQPNNDQNRLCNALSVIQKYNITHNMKQNDIATVYGLDIGFHIGDSTSQTYLQQHFTPNRNVLHELRFIILHGCHKERILSKKENEMCIDLFYDTLKALKNIIYIDLSCFCSKLKSTVNEAKDENDTTYYPVTFPTSVQCINFGFAFEILADNKMKIINIADLMILKLIYIELNPKLNKMPIQFISQFMLAPSLETVAINLAGLVWQNLRYDTTQYLENISKYWKINAETRVNKLNVVVITTQNGVHSAFKKIINDCYGNHDMINIEYLECTAGLKWLFEYVNNHIATDDLIFKKLWKLYHFSRSNFSPLHVNMLR